MLWPRLFGRLDLLGAGVLSLRAILEDRKNAGSGQANQVASRRKSGTGAGRTPGDYRVQPEDQVALTLNPRGYDRLVSKWK